MRYLLVRGKKSNLAKEFLDENCSYLIPTKLSPNFMAKSINLYEVAISAPNFMLNLHTALVSFVIMRRTSLLNVRQLKQIIWIKEIN